MNPLYLIVNKASGYIEENHGNKCLLFDSLNNELSRKYVGLCNEIKK